MFLLLVFFSSVAGFLFVSTKPNLFTRINIVFFLVFTSLYIHTYIQYRFFVLNIDITYSSIIRLFFIFCVHISFFHIIITNGTSTSNVSVYFCIRTAHRTFIFILTIDFFLGHRIETREKQLKVEILLTR